MPTCKSGRHTWSDAVSAERCCNGWHRELRLDGSEPGDDPEGRVYIGDLPESAVAFLRAVGWDKIAG